MNNTPMVGAAFHRRPLARRPLAPLLRRVGSRIRAGLGAALCAALCATAPAAEPSDADLLSAVRALLTQLNMTPAEAGAALYCTRALYLRENQTADGRRRWHGRLVSQAVDTNAAIRVSVYEDGHSFTDAFRRVTSRIAATPAATNGVPAALAAARVALAASSAATTNNVVYTLRKSSPTAPSEPEPTAYDPD